MVDRLDGVDVSAVQGKIDWIRVARADVAPGIDRRFRFATIKASEGLGYHDPRYLDNMIGARAAGLYCGGYHFFGAQHDAEAQAESLWRALGPAMPHWVSLDVEITGGQTAEQIVAAIRAFRDAWATRSAVPVVLYSFPSFLASTLGAELRDATDIARMPLWYAWTPHATDQPWYPVDGLAPSTPEPWRNAGKRVSFWQYSFGAGFRVDGIATPVDRDVFLGSEADLRALCGLPPLPTDPPPAAA